MTQYLTLFVLFAKISVRRFLFGPMIVDAATITTNNNHGLFSHMTNLTPAKFTEAGMEIG